LSPRAGPAVAPPPPASAPSRSAAPLLLVVPFAAWSVSNVYTYAGRGQEHCRYFRRPGVSSYVLILTVRRDAPLAPRDGLSLRCHPRIPRISTRVRRASAEHDAIGVSSRVSARCSLHRYSFVRPDVGAHPLARRSERTSAAEGSAMVPNEFEADREQECEPFHALFGRRANPPSPAFVRRRLCNQLHRTRGRDRGCDHLPRRRTDARHWRLVQPLDSRPRPVMPTASTPPVHEVIGTVSGEPADSAVGLGLLHLRRARQSRTAQHARASVRACSLPPPRSAREAASMKCAVATLIEVRRTQLQGQDDTPRGRPRRTCHPSAGRRTWSSCAPIRLSSAQRRLYGIAGMSADAALRLRRIPARVDACVPCACSSGWCAAWRRPGWARLLGRSRGSLRARSAFDETSCRRSRRTSGDGRTISRGASLSHQRLIAVRLTARRSRSSPRYRRRPTRSCSWNPCLGLRVPRCAGPAW